MNRARATWCIVAFVLAACRRTPAPPSEPESNGAIPPAAAVAPAYRAEAVVHGGTIRGRVVFDGAPPSIPAVVVPENATPNICGTNQVPPALVVSPTGGVRDTVLSIVGLDHGKPLPTTAPRIDQRGCQYVPHVAAGVIGQSIEFTSSDPTILHTIRGYRGDQGSESWFARATPAGVTVRVPLDRVGLGTVYCDSGHTWMLGYVWTFAHPYFAVSDGDGAFELRDVPAGNHTLHAWHEGFTPQSRGAGDRVRFAGAMERDLAVTVPANGVVNVRFVVSASGMRAEVDRDGG
jgi:hypothetical protein